MMRALPLDSQASPPICTGAAQGVARLTHRVRIRVRFKDDGSTIVVGVGSCGCSYLEDYRIATPRGLMALWLSPIVGSA